MKIKYRLSRGQHKQIDKRGGVEPVALPRPADLASDADLVAWARSVLDVPPDWVRSAVREDVVAAPGWRTTGEVQRCLGRLIFAEDILPPFNATIDCVIVTLQAVERARHELGPLRWPSSFEISE